MNYQDLLKDMMLGRLFLHTPPYVYWLSKVDGFNMNNLYWGNAFKCEYLYALKTSDNIKMEKEYSLLKANLHDRYHLKL